MRNFLRDRLVRLCSVARFAHIKRGGRLVAGMLGAALLASASAPALAASNVVISQVYGGGGNNGATLKADFIEVFNRGTTAINVNGWSVQYASATGNTWAVTNLPNALLQPGQYLLIQEALGAGGTADLPTPDATGTIALSATAGKVALVNNTVAITSPTAASVQDLVGFGSTANAAEGGTPAPAPSNSNAVLRSAGGCVDTDLNSADFAASGPTPRNSKSSLNACSGSSNQAILPQCPQMFAVAFNSNGTTTLTASDPDDIVSTASISSTAVAGITLSTTAISTTVNANSTFALNVAAGLAVGSYPVTVQFGNARQQTAQCVVSVSVEPAVGTIRPIYEIQGSGATSPLAGASVTTEGVVTLKVSNGFYVQDPVGDNNPATSDGIFVFTSTAPSVNVGDKVRLSATVAEFNAGDAARTVTQLTGVSNLVTLSSGNVITPVAITLPLASANDFERYEGMLVQFTAPLTVSQNFFQGRYGQVTLSSGRLEKATNRFPAGSQQAIAATAANAANFIVLDDGQSLQNPNPIPYIGVDNTLRAGDTVANLTGVIDFGLITATSGGPTGYKLQPSVPPVFSRDNPRTSAPQIAAGNVKVASFNVLNFFTTFTNGATAAGATGQGCSLGNSVAASNCRGANSLDEFLRQRAKIAAAMAAINADVFGLMEMQNNGDTAVANLADALNAIVGANTYAVVPQPPVTGTDAIRVAMIYKPANLSLSGVAMSDGDPINNRPPMAQTFVAANGERFSVVVNHLKSKSGCPTSASDPDADKGDGQGCFNPTRLAQAQRLLTSFIPMVQQAANDPDVIAIGDFNAYGAEDPINYLTANGLANQIERFVRPRGVPYSFIFDGESGYIDHALTSASMGAQVIDVVEWHINADEPSVIDYNLEFKPQDLYSASPYRASDHDPVVVSLNLQPGAASATNSVALSSTGTTYNRGTQQYATTLSLTNTSNAPIAGPLQVELSGLPAGVSVTNATGTHNGNPYFTLAIGSLAPNQTIGVAINFSDPQRVPISYQVKVYSGNF